MIYLRIRNSLAFALAWLASAAASPAAADMTATYAAPGSAFLMRIEVDDSGDVRGQVDGQNQYFVTIRGEGFIVQATPNGPLVTRVQDVAAVMAEQWQALSASADLADKLPSAEFVHKGTVTINGREGKAYFLRGADGKLSPQPVVVISEDPSLALLGKAMARQFEMSTVAMAQSIGKVPEFGREMQKILDTGAPLLFAGGELQSIDTSPIDSARFALPGSPETPAEVRARLMRPQP